ncbi:PNO1 [Candida pseudojiufengensis]|uniref:PNO1 n=1 Tax=Candida pseudojiufengensis TaxID=497109 RepID=UPI0022249734|nr:PNO1 [Candida pseudojiufengensis]KAI5961869.1 PNO1 [Candida pseudojiufengensis]
MSAPTALKQSDNIDQNQDQSQFESKIISQHAQPTYEDDDDDEMLIDTENVPITSTDSTTQISNTTPDLDETGKPKFTTESNSNMKVKLESRKVPVPPHRMTPLKNVWTKIFPPLVDHLKLQVRMNLKTKTVELRTNKFTTDPGALQKGADFVKAFTLGFDVDDAIALLRLDDLYIETFEIKDVKTLTGDHLSRAIGRIAGKDGKTKFAIENATRTRIVLADSKIHILGGFTHIRMAREAVVSLILGSPPGKVYGNLRTVASRMKERY